MSLVYRLVIEISFNDYSANNVIVWLLFEYGVRVFGCQDFGNRILN